MEYNPVMTARINSEPPVLNILSRAGSLATAVRNGIGDVTLTRDTGMGPSWDPNEVHVDLTVESDQARFATFLTIGDDQIDVFLWDAAGNPVDGIFLIYLESIPHRSPE